MEKTAMQQLRDKLEAEISEIKFSTSYTNVFKEVATGIISDIDAQMMEIEEKQTKVYFETEYVLTCNWQ